LAEGREFRWKGQYERAIDMLKELLLKDPANAAAWYELGLSYASEGAYRDAANAERLALEHGLQQDECHCALALALRESQQSRAALVEAKRCFHAMPRNAGALNLMGNAALDLDLEDEALEDYRQALALAPNYGNARLNLAWLEGDQGDTLDASRNYRLLLKDSPRLEAARKGLAEIEYKEGRTQEAQEDFLAAQRLAPQDPDPEWGLARSCRALGQGAEAKEHEAAYRRLQAKADRLSDLRRRREAAALNEGLEAWAAEEPHVP
jgi:tetratricopeptide (TPR) repeat protein